MMHKKKDFCFVDYSGMKPRCAARYVGALRLRSTCSARGRRITNTGGGNTSAKIIETYPLTGKPGRCCGSRAPAATCALPRGPISLDVPGKEKFVSLQEIYSRARSKALRARSKTPW